MLPKDLRLNLKNSKTRLKGSSEIFTPAFKMAYRRRGQGETPKIGFIVSGKVGKAAERSRIRRLLAEAVWANIERFPKGIEAILIASENSKKFTYGELCNLVNKGLSKIPFTTK